MQADLTAYQAIINELKEKGALLVAVSKTKSEEDIRALYHAGQRDFGENYVQELTGKQANLPSDIRWHFIGHLQTNKVKYIASFVHLIHGIDSEKLLKEVNKEAQKNGRTLDVLLQVHIASEETKFGWESSELEKLITPDFAKQWPHLRIRGLMGMASFTDDHQKIHSEFQILKGLFDRLATHLPDFNTLSMGMSADYKIALEEGSNLVRIGSLLFGSR